ITVYAGISCTRDALAECFLLPSLLWREGFGAEGLALGKFPLSLNPSPPSTGARGEVAQRNKLPDPRTLRTYPGLLLPYSPTPNADNGKSHQHLSGEDSG